MSAIGDRFISEGIDCEVVWTGGRNSPPFVGVQQRNGANCSLGNWYQQKRALRTIEPRANKPVPSDTRSYKDRKYFGGRA